jgi:hypothetical protein
MTRSLSGVEQAILETLDGYPDEEIPAWDLRGLSSSRGFRRTAPSLVFTMLSLVDKRLLTCSEEVRVVGGVEVKGRLYKRQGLT